MFCSSRRSRVVAAVAALSLIAAACGDDDDNDTNETGDEEAAATTPVAEDSEATDPPPPDTEADDVDDDDVADTTDDEDDNPSDAGSDIDRTGWPDTLVLAAVPSEEEQSLEASYAPLQQVIEEDLDIEVEFFTATNYAGIIEAQIAGNVHLAQYGPFSYVIARQNGANIEPAGAMLPDPDEEPGYVAYGIASADNDDINSIEDFEGRDVCFVDPASTSGYLYPAAGLLDAGIDPETDVNPIFAGGHDASAISVANGDCEAGFAFDEMVDTIVVESGDVDEGALKVVWESEVIAGSPISVHLDLPESLVAEIKRIVQDEANVDALVARGICESQDDCGLTDENVWGWVDVDDAFYDGVRAVCNATEADACEAA